MKPDLRYKTYLDYEMNIRVHLKPAIGHIKLPALTPQQVQSLLNAKRKAGLSPKSIANMRGVVREALHQAERWSLVSRNVVALAKPPKTRLRRRTVVLPPSATAALRVHRKRQLEARLLVGDCWQDWELVACQGSCAGVRMG